MVLVSCESMGGVDDQFGRSMPCHCVPLLGRAPGGSTTLINGICEAEIHFPQTAAGQTFC